MAYHLDRSSADVAAYVLGGVAGLAFAITPWALGFAAATVPAWSAWVAGAAAIVVALVAIYQAMRWEPWAFLVLGLWTAFAPWLLGFSAMADALWAHVTAGVILSAVGAWELWRSGHRPTSTV
jgi:hypothetical protein